jgi:hypothetical protein
MVTIQFAWPEGKAGAFTASYDDGVKEDRRLVQIFNQYGLRGTWNLNANRVAAEARPDGHIAWPELPTLYAGHEVAAHGLTHPWLDRIPEERILMEMVEDRRRLEAGVRYPVKGMSLPYGSYDGRVLAALQRAGIVHCRTTKATQAFGLPQNFLEWHPTCHHKAELARLWEAFSALQDSHKLFYLWGHSYEFDRNQNWKIIEDFGALVRAALDAGWLWSATNMEIYEYVTAWRQLWCSLDGTSFHNGCGVAVWLRAKSELVRIGPGETKAL